MMNDGDDVKILEEDSSNVEKVKVLSFSLSVGGNLQFYTTIATLILLSKYNRCKADHSLSIESIISYHIIS